jgi:hypothetical protein
MSLGTRRRLSPKDKHTETGKLCSAANTSGSHLIELHCGIAAQLTTAASKSEATKTDIFDINLDFASPFPIPPSLPVHPQLAGWLPSPPIHLHSHVSQQSAPNRTITLLSDLLHPGTLLPTVRDSCHRPTSPSSHNRASCFHPSISGIAGRRQAALTPAKQ